jgi:hypothetical protein
MSIHQNPDGSLTEGVKVEANGSFVAHEIGVAVTAASGLATVATQVTAGAKQVIVQADGQNVRYRLDGTNPTATVGVLILNGTSQIFNMTDAAAAKFIQVSATAVINATYTL